MSVPEHLWRFPTADAIKNLASRFDLPTGDDMQDWAWEVADPDRIDEFLDAYHNEHLTDDERFTLMETIIQSFADMEAEMTQHGRWPQFLSTIEGNIDLHIYSLWYWSRTGDELGGDQWLVTPFLRSILARHRKRFEKAT